MSKRLWYLALAVVLAIVLCWSGFQLYTRSVKPPAEEVVTLRVGSHTTTLSAALDVTEALGYFGQQGLRVLLDHQESSKITMPALISGDLVIAIGSNSAGSFNQLSTGKIAILSDAARVVPRLLVREDLLASGKVSSISDLRGRMIRVPREGSASHFALHRILSAHKVLDSAVELSFLDEQVALAELKRGGLDAGILNEPYASQAIQQNIAAEPWASQIGEIFGEKGEQHMLLFVNRSYADSHLSVIKRFLAAYRAGIRDYLKARMNPSGSPEVVRIIARYTGASPNLTSKTEWPWVSPDAMPDLHELRESQAYFVAKGLVKKPVEISIWSPPSL